MMKSCINNNFDSGSTTNRKTRRCSSCRPSKFHSVHCVSFQPNCSLPTCWYLLPIQFLNQANSCLHIIHENPFRIFISCTHVPKAHFPPVSMPKVAAVLYRYHCRHLHETRTFHTHDHLNMLLSKDQKCTPILNLLTPPTDLTFCKTLVHIEPPKL